MKKPYDAGDFAAKIEKQKQTLAKDRENLNMTKS